MAHIFGSIWDRINRNALNNMSEEVEAIGKSIQDLVADGQLTPTQYAELLNKLNDSSPKGVYTTLSALKTAYPYGAEGIYVVTENGNWYYWSNSEWTSGGVYQSTQWQNALTTQNEEWVI